MPEQTPDTLEHFGVEVSASVGPQDGKGAHLFDFHVCTPSWLAERIAMPKGFAFVRHALLVQRWAPEVTERAVRNLCIRTEGEDWTEIATKLSRFGYWEFED